MVNDIVYRGPKPKGRGKPIVLQYYTENTSASSSRELSIPAYTNDKVVLWDYGNITNISGVSGITRSGRIFAQVPDVEVEKKKKGKEAAMEEKNPLNAEGDAMVYHEDVKKGATDGEIQEFLKIVKQSEYMIVDQLKKTPAKISILELIMSLEPHRQVLLRMLNQAYVPEKIPTDSFDGIIGNVLATHLLSFTEEEIPAEGMGHNKALHISAMCRGQEIASMLIDNGSSLNVLPKETLHKLPVDRSYLKQVPMVVRAFDGTRREIIGEIEIPMEIANVTFNIPFVVMDILPTYSCLLGRPWIHTAGAVPSSLHQMMKFAHEGKVYMVKGQSEWMVANLENHIDSPAQGIESSFQSFEIANASFVREGHPYVKPQLSKLQRLWPRPY